MLIYENCWRFGISSFLLELKLNFCKITLKKVKKKDNAIGKILLIEHTHCKSKNKQIIIYDIIYAH